MFRPGGDGDASKRRCSNDYIQSWLEKTQRRREWEPPTEHPRDEEAPWRPHGLGAVDTAMPSHPPKSRKRRRRSFDSSIIPDHSRRRTLPTTMMNGPSTARVHRTQDKRGVTRRSATLYPAPRHEDAGPFEKRARHKTRPDRYDTRKRRNTGDGDGKQKARRTKTLEKKLVSSREVMDNFTSNAVLTDGRLTVKPVLTPGLYGNARCGSRNELPDLAYNSMGFLVHGKRRDDTTEESSMEAREGRTRNRREVRGSSPLFVPHSESKESIHGGYSEGEKGTSPLVWHPSHRGIPELVRPSTAPVEIESTYEPPRHRRYHGPPRAASNLDSPDCSPPDRSSPYGAVPPSKEAEDCNRSTPESVGRLLWETGVFDGLEGPSRSTSDKHRRLVMPTGRRSLRHRGTETRGRKRARFADESKTVALPGNGEGPAFKPSHVSTTAAQADGSLKTNTRVSKNGPGDHARPLRLHSPGLATTEAAVITVVGGAPIDRTKIALMAHIPVYCHQECQTEAPRAVPQKPAYVEASTQTAASPTQQCRQLQVPGDAPSSPVQRHGPAEESLVAGETQYVSDGSSWALDHVDLEVFRSYSPDRHGEILFQLASESHQAQAAFQRQVDLEAPARLCAGHGAAENSPPLLWRQPSSQFAGRAAAASSFVTPVDNDLHDEESPECHWGHEGHMESQISGYETSYDRTAPIHRYVDGETRTYHPYPVRYGVDRSAAVQPSNLGEFVGHHHREALGALAEEPYTYSQDAQYPHEQPPRPSRPGISSPTRNNIAVCECNAAGHVQDENQINVGGPSHLLAHQRQIAQEDLEQARMGAHWHERQLEFARRYGY